jgi:hypothetical protein
MRFGSRDARQQSPHSSVTRGSWNWCFTGSQFTGSDNYPTLEFWVRWPFRLGGGKGGGWSVRLAR